VTTLTRPTSRGSSARTAPGWHTAYARRLWLSDACVLAWLGGVTHAVWAAVPSWSGAHAPGDGRWLGFTVVWALLWHLGLMLAGSRDSRAVGAGPDEYKRIINCTIVLYAVVGLVAYSARIDLPRVYVMFALPFGVLLLLLSRWSWRQWLLVKRVQGSMTQRALVIGHVDAVSHLIGVVGRNYSYGYSIVGACVAGPHRPASVGAIPVVGGTDDPASAAVALRAQAVIVTSSDATQPQMVQRLAWDLEGHDVEIIVAPSLVNIAGPRVHIRPVAGLPLLHVEKPAYRGASRFAKAVLDRVGAALLLVAALPVLSVVAVAIKATSAGPVFYVQDRVGRDGQPFRMIKFRTMIDGAHAMVPSLRSDGPNPVMFKMRDDPRVTRVGATLRRYSLDELPQLINVLRGDMSLVGPRPPLLEEVSGYAADAHRRLLVRPGMTGPWQISGRADLDWQETMRLDLYYVENWSIVGDLLILVKTIKAVKSAAGAY
jgi:exopolysaccharide biosynthesis polyprenyl glycosylphosphotransferase